MPTRVLRLSIIQLAYGNAPKSGAVPNYYGTSELSSADNSIKSSGSAIQSRDDGNVFLGTYILPGYVTKQPQIAPSISDYWLSCAVHQKWRRRRFITP